MNLMSVAIQFTTEGQDKVRETMAGVRNEAKETGNDIPKALAPAKNEFGNLAKAVNHLGNELGLGLNRGLVMAAHGLNEASEATQQYIVKTRAAAGSTTLLASAQMLAVNATKALNGVLMAFGGIVGVTLIAAMIAYEKLMDHFTENAKKAEDAYDKVKDSTERQYQSLVSQEVAWLRVTRAVTDAAKQLDAYRRGGQRALDVTKDHQEALTKARAEWESIPGNLKQASDSALLADASFRALYSAYLKAGQLQRGLSDAIAGKQTAEDVKKSNAEVSDALFKQKQKNQEFFADTQTAFRKAEDDKLELARHFRLVDSQEQQDKREKDLQEAIDWAAKYKAMQDAMEQNELDRVNERNEKMAGVLTDGLSSAIEAAASGKNPLAALGASILSGLGSILIQMGTTALAAAPFVAGIAAALESLSGGALAAAGIGLIGVGSLLRAAGGSIGRSGGGGDGGSGGGGGGYSSPYQDSYRRVILGDTSVGSAAGIEPKQAINVTVIGPNDPVAQRQIQQLIVNADRRGS